MAMPSPRSSPCPPRTASTTPSHSPSSSSRATACTCAPSRSPDLVEVNFKIEEGPASQHAGGIGWSETYKFMLNGSYADADFLGTGQRVAINLNGGAFSKVYSVSHTNPYTSIDNVQRTISLTYSDVTQFVSSSSTF